MIFQELADGIWSAALPLRMPGLDIGTRTTLVRLGDGGLFVHSPGKLTPELRAEVDQLGEVRECVAPNKYHHLYVREWKTAYPEARIHAAPGLQEKRKSFQFDSVLDDEAPEAWRGVLDQHVIQGSPAMGEVVFFHPASRTLISCDLAMNIQSPKGLGARIFWTLNGVHRRFGPSRMVRLTIRDKGAARRSIDRLLEWDFDRVLIAHGESLETGGKETLRAAYSFL